MQTHSLVIGPPQITQAPALARAFADFLEQRADAASRHALVGPNATRSGVDTSLAAIRAAIVAAPNVSHQCVVAFVGHGVAASAKADPATDAACQGWQLADGSKFTDRALAAFLNSLATDVKNVVISNCCYGSGMFRPGVVQATGNPPVPVLGRKLPGSPQQLELPCELMLRALNLGWRDRLYSLTSSRSAAAMMLISLSYTSTSKQPDLFATVQEAITNQGTWGELADKFVNDFSGALYQLDARPHDRMCQTIFS